MSRVGRILLNAATAVSLVLFLAGVALWVRSYHVMETFTWYPGGDARELRHVYWSPGRLGLVAWRETMTPEQMKAANLMLPSVPAGIQYRKAIADPGRARPDDLDRSWTFFRPRFDRAWGGFRHRAGRVFSVEARQWVVPLWALVGLAAPLAGSAAVRVTRRVNRWRAGPGVCASCGYDLRATPDRCPECGTIPAR